MLRGVLFIVLCAGVKAAFEGEICVDNGVAGVCTNINKCLSALDRISRRQKPLLCSFDKEVPIVCCIDDPVTTRPRPRPLTTTEKSIKPETTTLYEPRVYDYEVVVETESEGCSPVESKLTTSKTGQKAWDKCVEYQEKLIYPCEKSTALAGGYQRKNYCYHNADKLVVGGENASKDEFPHMALLGYGNDFSNISWECGGSLISEKFILTAGHCLKHPDLGFIKYASLGVLSRSEVAPYNSYKIKNRFLHPDYRVKIYNDIALLELEKEVTLSAFIVPACLHSGERVNDARALATGWGLLGYHDGTPDILQKVIVNKIPTAECEANYPKGKLISHTYDSKTQVCYGDKKAPKDTCKGDSGGPLQVKHKHINCMYLVLGVTSGGRGCATRRLPGLYSKVSHHLAWIERIVWP